MFLKSYKASIPLSPVQLFLPPYPYHPSPAGLTEWPCSCTDSSWEGRRPWAAPVIPSTGYPTLCQVLRTPPQPARLIPEQIITPLGWGGGALQPVYGNTGRTTCRQRPDSPPRMCSHRLPSSQSQCLRASLLPLLELAFLTQQRNWWSLPNQPEVPRLIRRLSSLLPLWCLQLS